MTIPTYADLEPKARRWAVDRGLIHPTGSPRLATPVGQHRKTLEEIGEAKGALRTLAEYRAHPYEVQGVADVEQELKTALALEFGDVLVTLTLQAAMQGSTLEECRRVGPGNAKPLTWQFVDWWAIELGVSAAHSSKKNELTRMVALAEIGAIARCVEDEARIQLSLLGPECLALALAKISNRQGEVVDGVFVKA